MSAQDATPLLVLSKTRREGMAAQLRPILVEYLGEDLELSVAAISAFGAQCKDAQPGITRTLREQQRDVCRTFLSGVVVQDLLSGNTRAGAQHSIIAAATQAELLGSLAEQLAALWRLTASPSDSSCALRDVAHDAGLARWFMCIATRTGQDDVLATILLHPALIDRWIRRAQAAKLVADRGAARKAAIRDTRVRVNVVLGDADVSYADLAKLAVGDVLVLNQELSAPARLQSLQGTPIAKVQVGRAGERLGVQVSGLV